MWLCHINKDTPLPLIPPPFISSYPPPPPPPSRLLFFCRVVVREKKYTQKQHFIWRLGQQEFSLIHFICELQEYYTYRYTCVCVFVCAHMCFVRLYLSSPVGFALLVALVTTVSGSVTVSQTKTWQTDDVSKSFRSDAPLLTDRVWALFIYPYILKWTVCW